ncbi:MAG: trigger factor [Aggregatilineales bacterium]
MNVQTEHLENQIARLTVDVEPARLQKAMQAAAQRIGQKINVPGFRRGKAPYAVIARYVGANALLEEAIDSLGDTIYKEALDQTGLKPYATAELQDIKADANQPENPVQLVFSVPLPPEIDLGAYRENLRLPYEPAPISDESVDRFMRLMQENRAVIEPAGDRPAQIGDKVKLKLTGTITHSPEAEAETEAKTDVPVQQSPPSNTESPPEAGAPEPSAAATEPVEPEVDELDEDLEIFLRTGDDDYMPGFSEQIAGMKAGEQKSFTLKFPDDVAGKSNDHLIGATAELTAELQEVNSATLPALNDDFARQVSDGKSETLLEYRIDARKTLQTTLDKSARSLYIEAALDKLIENATFKFPEVAIEESLDDVIRDLQTNMSERGLSLDEFLKLEKRSIDELRTMYREVAAQRLKRTLALTKLIEVEHLHVTDADIDAEIDRMSQGFGEQADTFKHMMQRENNRNSVIIDLLQTQGFDRLAAIARGENPPIDHDHDHDHEHQHEPAGETQTQDTAADQPSEPHETAS